MGYVKPSSVDRLPLPSDPEFWVEMRSKAHYGAKVDAQAAMLKMTLPTKEDGSDAKVEPDMAAFQLHKAVGLIVAWNLTDENERPLPINAESIRALDPQDGDFISEAVNARMALRVPAEEGPFEKPSTTPSLPSPDQP